MFNPMSNFQIDIFLSASSGALKIKVGFSSIFNPISNFQIKMFMSTRSGALKIKVGCLKKNCTPPGTIVGKSGRGVSKPTNPKM